MIDDIRTLVADPRYLALPQERRSQALEDVAKRDQRFLSLPDHERAKVLTKAVQYQVPQKEEIKQTPEHGPAYHSLAGSFKAAASDVAGSASTLADQAAGLIVGGAQAAGEAFGWAKNAIMGKPQAAQQAVSAMAPLDHLQGGYSQLVDATFGKGASSNSQVGQVFGMLGKRIEEGQSKYSKGDPEKQAQAKVVTDFAMNYLLPHALGLAGKAVGKLTGAKVEVPPVDHADLKAKLNQIAPDMPEAQVNHVVEQVAKISPELDKHINAETKAHDLMQRGASKKEVEAVIKKNPLVGTKMEEIRQRRAEAIGAMKETKQGEILPPEAPPAGPTLGAPKEPTGPSGTPGEPTPAPAFARPSLEAPKAERGAVDKRLLAAMGGGAAAALAYPMLSKEHRQNIMLAGVLGMMGATDMRAVIKPMGEHLSGVDMTPAFKDFIKSGAFQEHFDSFAKDTNLPWHQKPDFKIHEGKLTFHPEDAGVVKSFIQYLSETPYGERAEIPPKLRQGVAPEHIEAAPAPAWGDKLEDFHGVFTKEAIDKAKEGHVVMMAPEEFNKLAYPREATYRDLSPEQVKALGEEKRAPLRASLAAGKGIRDIPELSVKDGKVVGHDGRHRVDVLMEQGYDKIPVRIKGEPPAAGQMLTSETGDYRTQAPLKVPRGQAGAVDPELLAKMGLTAGGALAGYLLAGQNKADKPAGAILGALLGFGGVHAIAKGALPKAMEAISTNWKHSLATTITSAGAVGVGAYLDEENRLEGALFGAAFAASRNMPKAKHLSEEELIAAYHDGLVAHDRIIGNVVSAVKQYIPDENARQAFYEKLHRKDFSNMTPGEKEVAATWKRMQVQYGEAAKDAGVIKGFIEDYVPRIASKIGMPESEVQRLLAEIVPERTNVSGSTKTKYSKSRTQDTFDDFLRAAKEKGLDVSNVDFADVMGNYLRSMNKAIQSAKLIKTLEEAKGKDGTLTNLIVGAEKAPSDYKSVNNPQLRGKRVHPEIADALEIVMGGKSHHDVTNAALAVTSALKRMNVVGSFFHAKSLIEAHLLAGRNPAGLHGIRSALEAFKNGGAGDNIDKLIRSGLMVGLPDDAPIGTFGKLGELLDHAINRSLGTGVKTFGKAFTAAEKAQMATFDKVTWDFLHTGFKLSAALREMELYRTGKKYQGMSEQEALKGISSAINDTYGGINWARAHQEAQTVVGRKLMGLISTPNGRDMMGLLLFAPDWTLSTLRMFSKALPGGTANPANAALSRKYVRNSIIAYMTAINLANIAFSGHPIWENKKDKTKVELPDGTSMQLMKHSMEPYEFIHHPTKFLTNKLGVPVKLGSLALTGSTSFNPMYPVDSKVGAAVSLVSPFTVNPFTDPNVSMQDALLRSAAGTLGVGIYGTTNAMKQTEEYKRRQRERYARMHGRVPKQ